MIDKFEPNDTILKANKQRLDAFAEVAARNMAYVAGRNYTIENARAVVEPDNRIPVPLAKAAITNIVGYAGRPGQIETSYRLLDSIDEDYTDDITDLLSEFDAYNEEGIENSELLTTSLSCGIAYELWWVSESTTPGLPVYPEYRILPINQCYPVWDGALKPNMIAFIRYWEDESTGDKIADVYYPKYSERWRNKSGSYRATDGDYVRDQDGDTVYPYNRVPVIQYRTSMHNTPVFNAERPIIDAFDKLVSKTQNEVDRYNALITLFPGGVDSDFIRQLTELSKPYIANLDEFDPASWPRYLEKNLSGVNEFYASQADRLERLFHKTINIPDMSDEQFAGSQSGVAIAYKLIGFEFLVSEIEVYFRKGLTDRFDLYFDCIEDGTLSVNRDNYEQVITWKRNLPVDDEAKVRIAAMLMGLGVSMETILKFLPSSIIADARKELEKMGETTEDDGVATTAGAASEAEVVVAQ